MQLYGSFPKTVLVLPYMSNQHKSLNFSRNHFVLQLMQVWWHPFFSWVTYGGTPFLAEIPNCNRHQTVILHFATLIVWESLFLSSISVHFAHFCHMHPSETHLLTLFKSCLTWIIHLLWQLNHLSLYSRHSWNAEKLNQYYTNSVLFSKF